MVKDISNTTAAQTGVDRLLEVRDLKINFGSGTLMSSAVTSLSFDLHQNQTLAIVGESGSGKSVSALALLGLLKHLGGHVAEGSLTFQSDIHGRAVDLAKLDEQQLRSVRGNEIAMIFQEPMTSLNPVFTIGSQIAETLALHRGMNRSSARAEVRNLLDLVRLPNAARLLDNYPHQLSGGMRQRAMIAMALSCQPKVLIADEPTTALDVTIQAEILYIIRELQAEFQTAVVFISHDMGVVSEMADEVLVMRHGALVEKAPVTEIFERPQADYTRDLLAAVPKLGSMKGTNHPKVFDIPGQDKVPAQLEIVADTTADSASAEPVIEVRDLTTRYDIRGGLFNRVTHRVHAAEKISFSIRVGETLALVGESGSGKSTVGKTIQQLVEPVSGQVHFRGHDIFTLPKAQRKQFRREIQYVFQDPYGSLNPRKTVGASILEPALTHGLANATTGKVLVSNLLVKVGLDAGYAARYPHEFSGGQRQRVCIARALACDPRLIIADETVSALDVSVQARVVNLLMRLQAERGLAYLFISHDMAVVERVSHRVAVMYLGQLVEIGSRQQIFEDPQHSYTKKLLAAVPVVDPSRRPTRPPLDGDIPSPMRSIDDPPAIHTFNEVNTGHFVANEAGI